MSQEVISKWFVNDSYIAYILLNGCTLRFFCNLDHWFKTRWFKVTFSSSGWRSLGHWKGSLVTSQKGRQQNCQGETYVFSANKKGLQNSILLHDRYQGPTDCRIPSADHFSTCFFVKTWTMTPRRKGKSWRDLTSKGVIKFLQRGSLALFSWRFWRLLLGTQKFFIPYWLIYIYIWMYRVILGTQVRKKWDWYSYLPINVGKYTSMG